MLRLGLLHLLLAAAPLLAQVLTPGEAYELELGDGSRLNHAVYRGQENGASLFEIPSVVGPVRITEYRVVPQYRPLPWVVGVTAGYYQPMNQAELGFSQGIGGAVAGSIPVFSQRHPLVPRLTLAAGFARYSGSKALLSGPELLAGPGWLFSFGESQRLFAQVTLSAGAAFYQLINQNIRETFSQDTFIASAEAGIGFRSARWGVLVSYAQNYLYDQKLPFTTGAIRLAAVYFGGNL